MKVIRVDIPLNTSGHAYDVVIGANLLEEIQSHLPVSLDFQKALILMDQALPGNYGDKVQKALSDTSAGREIFLHSFKSGEEAKSLGTMSGLYNKLVSKGLERTHPVFSLGGGVTGDIAGFAAATYLRGVPFVQIPTTLLAMVDASIGGKVGCNHPMGKNLIGAFYQPSLVLIDIRTLQTLPGREFRSGLAECIKHALIADWQALEWMDKNMNDIQGLKDAALIKLIEKNVTIKAGIVAEDEKEKGKRALLNLGHTFGHAIEVTSGYGRYTHGEAVALGCMAACDLASRRGLIPADLSDKARHLTEKAGFPGKGRLAPVHELMAAMKRDKKTRHGRLRLVLPTGYGEAGIFNDIPDKEIKKSWESISQ